MNIAIITGASSGLGRKFTELADVEGLDELWLIARRKDRLQELSTACQTKVRSLPLDLTQKTSLQQINKLLQEEQPMVKILVNAAGFGKIGSYADIAIDDMLHMIDLNCRAAVAITQSALPHMERGCRILEICSIAGFQPIPYLGVYAASKAFLYRYSRALALELQPRGIIVTAVCPYWIKDTEFISVAQKSNNSSYFHAFPFACSEAFVSRRAWQAAKNGAVVVTPGIMASIDRILAKFMPHGLMMRLSNLFRKL